MQESGYLVLESGQIFSGELFGHMVDENTIGEVVFQTGMTSYPEILTDPSHKNHILILTYPLIGNYGVPENIKDKYGLMKYLESNHIHVSGLVIGELVDKYSHWNSEMSLRQWFINEKVIGISGIDTRELTKIIREQGTVKGIITSNLDNAIFDNIKIDDINVVNQVTTKNIKILNKNGSLKVLVIDCGVKHTQLKLLLQRDVCLIIIPYNYDFLNTDLQFDRIFITNGPGDPTGCQILIDRLRIFMETNHSVSIFGICLGHQILSLASGASTYKMKYGNRGFNIPCQLLNTKKCYITSQNHGYAVDNNTLHENWLELFRNANDSTNEGIYHKLYPWFSVQFHPEAKGGPQDTDFLFDIFLDGSIHDYINNIKDMELLNISYNKKRNKVLILGSGGLSIGQSGEFDYSGSQAIKAYNKEGLTTILINPNIATVQTSPGFADKVYFLPVTYEYVLEVIKTERPDCITISFGGQTALNLGIELYKKNVFKKYNMEILGTNIESVICTEDRKKFKNKINSINESIPEGKSSSSFEDAVQKGLQLGFPLLVRAAYALGGLGSGFAHNEDELKELLTVSFSYSDQVILDKSLKGWKEIEYEVVRDRYDNCITVCNMENIDPLGVHTGESIVVVPSQTLTDEEYNMLRSVAIKVIRSLEIVGECNIQYALNPISNEYFIIEVNARLSRSSALASKATGYPLAYIAAKLSLGYSLLDIKNSITKETTACFEPSLDYCVVKVPRWDLEKFPKVDKKINSSMKSVGESMAISRNFEEAFQKALRMSNNDILGFEPIMEYSKKELSDPSYKRIFAIADALYKNELTVDEIYNLSGVDRWFLYKMKNIMDVKKKLEKKYELNEELLRTSKQLGFSDLQIAKCVNNTELNIRNLRNNFNIKPVVKQIDTVSAEYPCYTNYLYLTYNGSCSDINFKKENSIMVLGSGVYKIGSSVEFDWCCVSCVRELRNMNYKTIVLNCNPETVSTDYDEADKLYFDELSFERVLDIYELENPNGIILSMGGQIPNNIAIPLYRTGKIKVIGTHPEMIDRAENRFKFSRMLENIGVDQPVWKKLTTLEQAKNFCQEVGYPCLVRPSYVLSGVAMNVAYSDDDLEEYLNSAVDISKDHSSLDRPVVISKFINDAKEIEVDAVAINGNVKLLAISEHIENAGVHSGDATLVLPPHDLTEETLEKIRKSVYSIAKSLDISGPFNIQFIAKDNKIKTIECNLRVSRTFPFVSKTFGINFINIATRLIMNKMDKLGHDIKIPDKIITNRVGVKVSQFSFNRLKGADITLGVEMVSTGEVACFGKNHYEAYYKAIQASKFVLPKKSIMLSIGSYKFKTEFLESVKLLNVMGFKLYGTSGTADFYQSNGIPIQEISLVGELERTNMKKYFNNKYIDTCINISRKNKLILNKETDGYIIRRLSVDSSVPLITDIKQAKLFVKSLYYHKDKKIRVRTDIDCFTTFKTITIPGLIDIHVHVREPGDIYKEDWSSCTKAALAGGITTILAMPNTNPSLINEETYKYVDHLAQNKAYCDYGLYVGATSDNYNSIKNMSKKVAGLKMYLNQTHGTLLLNNTLDWINHIKNWPNDTPLCVHAENTTLAAILHFANLYNKNIHICHVARAEEIEIIKQSKINGNMNITCEVSPHHLFLTCDNLDNLDNDNFKEVRPPLMTKADQQALWTNMDIIDCFATDHAPHTIDDKINKKCPGFAGLETALPLLLTAVKQGRLSLNDIIDKYYNNPIKIFKLPKQPNTFIEIDMDKEWIIPEKPLFSKCGWTPFANTKVTGLVKRVVLRGKTVYIDGQVVSKMGSGKNVRNIVSADINIPNIDQITDLSLNMKNIKPEINTNINHIQLKNIISTDEFDRDMLRTIFDKAVEMKICVEKGTVLKTCNNKYMVSLFLEPNIRTQCSFDVAMKRLGGNVINVLDNSSVKKGECIEDTVRCLESYCDIIVLKSSNNDDIQKASNILNIPIINAGDGTGEHPTQALLDIFTIREEKGTVNGLNITIVGDLKNGRTIYSLVKLLSLYDVTLNYVSPVSLQMPNKIKQYVQNKGINQTEYTNIEDVISKTDVLYVTGIQQTSFVDTLEYDKVKNSYMITLKLLKDYDLIVMHPLPRINEISKEIDNDERAVYFRQMKNSLYVRMVLIESLL